MEIAVRLVGLQDASVLRGRGLVAVAVVMPTSRNWRLRKKSFGESSGRYRIALPG